jgi:hypothetical protein
VIIFKVESICLFYVYLASCLVNNFKQPLEFCGPRPCKALSYVARMSKSLESPA